MLKKRYTLFSGYGITRKRCNTNSIRLRCLDDCELQSSNLFLSFDGERLLQQCKGDVTKVVTHRCSIVITPPVASDSVHYDSNQDLESLALITHCYLRCSDCAFYS